MAGTAQPAAVVSLDTVGKTYPGADTAAVADLSLDIREGEFFSILGPSGSGKTSTLRMIAGFESPTTGRVLLDGVDVSFTPPYERDVNTVFQSYALFPHMSVRRNVEFPLRMKRMASAQATRRAVEALELVEMAGFVDRMPHQLSGGQRQRVALARALVGHPRVLLLDEPLGALDLRLRQQMQLVLKRLQREVGVTFVYVTHDQGEALSMSDRLAVMNHGRVEHLGTPAEVYQRPATTFVATFIGKSNVLPCTVDVGPAGPRAHFGNGWSVAVDPSTPPGPARLSIRCESLALTVPGAAADLVLPIEEVVFLGDTVELVAGDGTLSVTARASAPAALGYRRGDTAHLVIDPGGVVVLHD